MRTLLTFLSAPVFAAALSYEINFVGLKDSAVLKSMFDVSDLVVLQDRPPASINGLRYRIASDIPSLMKVLHAYGYYDAAITSEIDSKKEVVQVFLLIRPGPQYTLASYEVYHGDCTEIAALPNCCPFTPESLDLEIGKPAIAANIINAELQLLTELARCGYPLAAVEKRKVEVDMAAKDVAAASCINEGPLSKFGPTTIFGLEKLDPSFIEKRIRWQEGMIYNPDAVEETQKRLLNTDLFSSVMVTHGDELDSLGELPMKMSITEALTRQFAIGAYYATVDGPGVSLSWVHRNVWGKGDIFSIDADISKRYIAGSATYKILDFLVLDQTYKAVGEVYREDIHPYLAFTYWGGNYLERKIDSRRNFSVGFKVEHINISESATNGTYLLAGLPVFLKYYTPENPLDPVSGYSMVYQALPYQSLFHANQRFIDQRLTNTIYIPVVPSKFLVLAIRTQLGSIAGTRQKNVPLNKLFLGGSEDDLRGYRYKTVSPLDARGRPLGGRSAIFISLEARFRFYDKIGIVPFADFGTVTFSEIPQVDAKWFKSIGIGARYFSFFGPLRLDVAFPLDRREGIDSFYQIYASVGQTF